MRGTFPAVSLLAAAGIMVAAPSENAKYIGVDKCKMCHSSGHTGWS